MSGKGLICRVYKVNREKLKEAIKETLDILYKLDPESVKEWACTRLKMEASEE